MKLAIVGGRDFNNRVMLSGAMHFFDTEVETIVSGGARGANSLGEEWAISCDIPTERYLPNWNKYGRAAEYLRNQEIVDACDMVLAFWDGKSRGTQDTIAKAQKAKKPTFIVYY